VKKRSKLSRHKVLDKGRPDYYITPTRDFKQYTKDCEEKYWNQDTAFDWNQDVRINLKDHLEKLNPVEFSRIAFMVLPMIADTIEHKIAQIQQEQLPLEEDALKDIGECIPFDKTTIHEALSIQSPLKDLQLSVLKLKDQAEILQSELLDLREQQRLGLVKEGNQVKHLETEAERQAQQLELSQMTNQIKQVQDKHQQLKAQCTIEAERLKTKIQEQFHAIEHQVLSDLEETLGLLQDTLQSRHLPKESKEMSRIKDLIW